MGILIEIAGILFYAAIVIIPVVVVTHYFHIVDYSCIREQIQEQKPTPCATLFPKTEQQKTEIAAVEQGKPDDPLRPEVTETKDNTQDPKTLRNSLLTGAMLILTYREDDRDILRFQNALARANEFRDEANINKYESKVSGAIADKRLTLQRYLQELRRVQQVYKIQQLRAELPVLENELAIAGDRTGIGQFARLYVSQAEIYRQPNFRYEGKISQDLLDFQLEQ